MSSKIIPIVLTFNENYVIPAGVAMYSLMEHADDCFIYEFNIIHAGLSVTSQKKLIKNLKYFKNQKINFIYSETSFENIFKKLKSSQHFSVEMFYKLVLPSLFPQYDKVIVSDVDVIFEDDISPAYIKFAGDYYIAAIKHYSKSLITHLNLVYKHFSAEYRKKINNFGAGFMIFNLQKMRQDCIEDKMLDFLQKNIEKLIYPEQEVINYVCSNHILYTNLKYMMCSCWVKSDINNIKSLKKYYPYKTSEVIDAYHHPVQIHYASSIKPWNNTECFLMEKWFQYLVKTVFLKDYIISLEKQNELYWKKLFTDAYNLNKYKVKYLQYKILSKITFGNLKKKYNQKRKYLKLYLRQLKNII